MTTGQRRSRKPKAPPTFEFTYQSKDYIIRGSYAAQPAVLFLADGAILHVRTWKISALYEPQPYQVESFDPQQHTAAELAAAATNGFVAELQEGENGSAAVQE